MLALQFARIRTQLVEDLAAEDLDALDHAIAALEAGTSTLAATFRRAVWVVVRPDNAENTGFDVSAESRVI